MNEQLIYLDNAATTFPKPPGMIKWMVETYTRLGVSPGRGSYDLAVEAAEFVQQARQRLACLLGAPDPERVIWAANATDALNLAIQGMVQPGDHVVSTRLEHNAVLRPLYHLQDSQVIAYTLVPFDARGFVDPNSIARAIRPNTRLVVVCHASNVLGTLQPAAEIGRICAEHGVPLLLDVAQSAGQVPIDMTAWNVSAVAFTGHKSLLGPMGIGGLILSPDVEICSTRFGGTGIESQSLIHTQTFPHRLEAGTLNMLGIAGLLGGLGYLQREGMEKIHLREMGLLAHLQEGLEAISGVTVYGPRATERQTPVLACNIEGLAAPDVGAILDGDYGIAVRTGLHCAPLVHADYGLLGRGTVRFSTGYFNTEDDLDQALNAMTAISRMPRASNH